MQKKVKITEEDLLHIINEFYNDIWKYSYDFTKTRIVGISKVINEDGKYMYDLTMEN